MQGDTGDESSETTTSDVGSESPTEAAPAPADPDYRMLTEKQLRRALLTIEDLPPGYSADPGQLGERPEVLRLQAGQGPDQGISGLHKGRRVRC